MSECVKIENNAINNTVTRQRHRASSSLTNMLQPAPLRLRFNIYNNKINSGECVYKCASLYKCIHIPIPLLAHSTIAVNAITPQHPTTCIHMMIYEQWWVHRCPLACAWVCECVVHAHMCMTQWFDNNNENNNNNNNLPWSTSKCVETWRVTQMRARPTTAFSYT